MALDAQAQELVEMVAASGAPPFWSGTPAEARSQMAAIAGLLREGPSLERVEDLVVGAGESARPARLFVPSDPKALIIYLHGGGWVFGTLAEFEPMCRALAARSQTAVLWLDYRLAPENPFPAALEDALEAVRWATSDRMPLAKTLPVIIAGDSAGGNLAAVVARRVAPDTLQGQVLIYPVLQPNLDTPTYLEFSEGPTVGREAMAWFWSLYVPDATMRKDPRVSPLLDRQKGAGVPALILTAEYDPLRWEGEAYAEALRADGVPVQLERFSGLPHGFFTLVGLIDKADDAIGLVADWISDRLHI